MSATRSRLVRFGFQESQVGWIVTEITGHVAKGRDGSPGVRPNQVINVALKRLEDADEHIDVVDTNTHLQTKQQHNKQKTMNKLTNERN